MRLVCSTKIATKNTEIFTNRNKKDMAPSVLVDEGLEFERVHMVMQSRGRGGFGRNNTEPVFNIRYETQDAKNAACRVFGPKCLTYAEDTHVASDVLAAYINRSQTIDSAVEEVTPAEAMTWWRRWQQWLCQWHVNTKEARPRGAGN